MGDEYRSEDPEINPAGWKARFTERLQEEGRLEEFWVDLKVERARLKREGLAAGAEAKEQAWRTVMVRYGKSEAIERLEREVETEGEWEGAGSGNLVEDILWVYDHLEDLGAVKRKAPSRGAWGLLKYAREDRRKFYEQLLPKAMAARDKRGAEEKGEESAAIGLLDKLLEEKE